MKGVKVNYLAELPFAATFEIKWFSDSLADLTRMPCALTSVLASVLILHTTAKEKRQK